MVNNHLPKILQNKKKMWQELFIKLTTLLTKLDHFVKIILLSLL